MARFTFRAAAALDLRKKDEDRAAVALGAAEAVLRRIAGEIDAAVAAHRQAQEAASTAARQGTGVAAFEWHRNWIDRQAATVARLHLDHRRQQEAVAAAEAVWREARRKRLALERMRERALRRFEQHQAQVEMKAIDELARLRYVAADRGDE
jgi:flagellar export protein FliJ